MTKKVLIADLKHFCNDAINRVVCDQKETPRMSSYYEYLEGRIESLQLVINKLDDYD